MVKEPKYRLYPNKHLTKGQGFSLGECLPKKDTGGKPMKNESPEQCPKRITEEPEDEGVKAILAEAGRRMEKRNKNAVYLPGPVNYRRYLRSVRLAGRIEEDVENGITVGYILPPPMTSSFVRLQSYLWNFDRGNGLFGLPQEVTALADYAEVYTRGRWR